MKAIIPAKASSLRVPDKNFRPFFGEKSLVDLVAEKLLKLLDPKDIYLSSEDGSKEAVAEKHGINFLIREPALACNDTPMPDYIKGICDLVPTDDIAWCQVIDPMFDAYGEAFDMWDKSDADSLVVVYPQKEYFLNENYVPEGFGFGHWHVKSQLLPVKYHLTFTLSVLTSECVKKHGYFVGANPVWFHASNHHVDIDTMEDFELAQSIYAFFNSVD